MKSIGELISSNWQWLISTIFAVIAIIPIFWTKKQDKRIKVLEEEKLQREKEEYSKAKMFVEIIATDYWGPTIKLTNKGKCKAENINITFLSGVRNIDRISLPHPYLNPNDAITFDAILDQYYIHELEIQVDWFVNQVPDSYSQILLF